MDCKLWLLKFLRHHHTRRKCKKCLITLYSLKQLILSTFSLLDHSLFGEEAPDICFIIRDQKSKKTEQIVDETVLAFETKLTGAGITNIKTIMPLTKLKQDFGPNSMKLKLLNTYDLFLVESEIAEHVYTILGKVSTCELFIIDCYLNFFFFL